MTRRREEVLELSECYAGLATVLQIYKDTVLVAPPGAELIGNVALFGSRKLRDPRIQTVIEATSQIVRDGAARRW